MDPVTSKTSVESNSISSVKVKVKVKSYSPYLSYKVYKLPGGEGNMEAFMNGPIKQKLKIIPPNVTYVPIHHFIIIPHFK